MNFSHSDPQIIWTYVGENVEFTWPFSGQNIFIKMNGTESQTEIASYVYSKSDIRSDRVEIIPPDNSSESIALKLNNITIGDAAVYYIEVSQIGGRQTIRIGFKLLLVLGKYYDLHLL